MPTIRQILLFSCDMLKYDFLFIHSINLQARGKAAGCLIISAATGQISENLSSNPVSFLLFTQHDQQTCMSKRLLPMCVSPCRPTHTHAAIPCEKASSLPHTQPSLGDHRHCCHLEIWPKLIITCFFYQNTKGARTHTKKTHTKPQRMYSKACRAMSCL